MIGELCLLRIIGLCLMDANSGVKVPFGKSEYTDWQRRNSHLSHPPHTVSWSCLRVLLQWKISTFKSNLIADFLVLQFWRLEVLELITFQPSTSASFYSRTNCINPREKSVGCIIYSAALRYLEIQPAGDLYIPWKYILIAANAMEQYISLTAVTYHELWYSN